MNRKIKLFLTSILLIVIVSCNNVDTANNVDIIISSKMVTNPDTLHEYYSNGNIKLIRIKDTLQEKIILYKYDIKGNIQSYILALKYNNKIYANLYERSYINDEIKDNGYIISSIITNENNDKKSFVGDTFTISAIMACPPNCLFSLICHPENDTINYKRLELKKNKATYEFLPDTSGKYNFILSASLKDTLRDTIVNHNVLVILNVESPDRRSLQPLSSP